MNSYWHNKRVAVTGGAGFIGSHVVQSLMDAGCSEIIIVRSRDYDLTKEENCIRMLKEVHPSVVIHLAGLVGGIGANQAWPADFFYQNLTMGTFLLDQSWKLGIEKFIGAGAGCGYPEHAPMPLKETSFWEGLPQEESAPYSLAKRLLHIQSIAYYQQHGFVSILGIPGNVYGPFDSFDLEAGHVVPALIRKFTEAVERKDPEVVVWGTGKPTRDFVYAGDVATGLLLAGEQYNQPELVNISSGVETSIKELVETVAELTGFEGKIIWDSNRPDGQLRRCFDISKAQQDLGFKAKTDLKDGLSRTIAWFKEHRSEARLTI